MNYSTLLTRSVDFDDYAAILYPSYPTSRRPLLLAMIQMMWDRGEPNGYANHMTSDPLPGTPAHHVLIEMAYGDHQVSNVATEVEASTIGAPLRYPTLDPGRTPGFVDFFPDIPTLDLPADANGNGCSSGTSGRSATTAWADARHRPGPDHEHRARRLLRGRPARHRDPTPRPDPAQIASFLDAERQITDPCGSNPCYAAGWAGPP